MFSSPDSPANNQLNPYAMSSTDTFDLSYCLAVEARCYSPLLEVSFSMHSLPTVSSSDTIPDFPPRSLKHKVHVDTYLSLPHPKLRCPLKTPASDNKSLLAAPTAPRLRSMMKEPLHIKKWLNDVTPTSMHPTSSARKVKHSTWKPEGSLHSPGHLSKSLRKEYSNNVPEDCRRINRIKMNRNALVLEREIKLGTGPKRRASVKVPAASASAETIEDILNLKRLNAYFKASCVDTNLSPSPNTRQPEVDNCAHPPYLMVSTSEATFPISLDSTNSVPAERPMTLAARRGKSSLKPLTLKRGENDEPYPGIPTAFLGAPSNYMPSPGDATNDGSIQMDLQAMLSALRSCRVPMPFLSAADIDEDDLGVRAGTTGFQDDNSGEWAVADAFVSQFGNISLGSSTETSVLHTSSPASADDCRACEKLAAMKREHPRKFSLPPIGGPPNLPLPPRPVLGQTPPREVRGILKGCKSVRFASLPSRQRPDQNSEHYDRLGRLSDSKLKHSRVRELQNLDQTSAKRHSTISSNTATAHLRLPNPFGPAVNQGRLAEPKTDATCGRPASTPSCKAKNTQVSKTSTSVTQRHSIGQQTVVPPKSSATPVSRLRSRVSGAGNKENEKRSTIPSTFGKRRVIDENVGRRDSSPAQVGDASVKKRMQVPLRSILTRFK
ncbi:hypothetical protein AX17_002706 [Amanita inopinata Kibby_2008]|nr:hypothetical protein AX17_002706 [Amanita inopinata Kibby_2008]